MRAVPVTRYEPPGLPVDGLLTIDAAAGRIELTDLDGRPLDWVDGCRIEFDLDDLRDAIAAESDDT